MLVCRREEQACREERLGSDAGEAVLDDAQLPMNEVGAVDMALFGVERRRHRGARGENGGDGGWVERVGVEDVADVLDNEGRGRGEEPRSVGFRART